MENWVGTIECAYSFSKSKKDVLSVQGAWHSPNTLPIVVHCQAFNNITRQPPNERAPPIHQSGTAGKLCGFEPCEPSPLHRNDYFVE
jgi:hypothetical protein